jgi:hypothetical protein
VLRHVKRRHVLNRNAQLLFAGGAFIVALSAGFLLLVTRRERTGALSKAEAKDVRGLKMLLWMILVAGLILLLLGTTQFPTDSL